ncbi:hypothetical protein SEUCBS139899_004511 [Sporothrix eucalyptigena]
MVSNKKKKKAAAAEASKTTTEDKDKQTESKPEIASSSAVVKASSSTKTAKKISPKTASQDTGIPGLAAAFATHTFQPTLKITRHKYWRYANEYSGAWLTMTTAVTKALTWTNYNKSVPRYLDNGFCFDLMHIRDMVDLAIRLSVGATLGQTPSSPGSAQSNDGRGPQMSAMRRHRLRVEAVNNLAEAYSIDEIATSLLVMQNAASLEDLPRLVLERAPDNRSAKYVDFFHKKIPSQKFLESTTADLLDPIVESEGRDGAAWRTRGVIKLLQSDFEGAVVDLTESLRLARIKEMAAFSKRHMMAEEVRDAIKAEKVGTKDEGALDQITSESIRESLEKLRFTSADKQARFHRGTAYLNMACQCIYAALGPEWVKHEKRRLATVHKAALEKKLAELKEKEAVEKNPEPATDKSKESAVGEAKESADSDKHEADDHNGDDEDDDDDGGAAILAEEIPDDDPPTEKEADNTLENKENDDEDEDQTPEQRKEQLRLKRQMRMRAKQALHDFLAFLSTMDYAPNVAIHTGETFLRRVVQTAVGHGNSGSGPWILKQCLALMKDFKAKREAQPNATLPDPPDPMVDKDANLIKMSALLDGSPLPDLPVYPSPKRTKPTSTTQPSLPTTPTKETEAESTDPGEPTEPTKPTELVEKKPNSMPTTQVATFHPLLPHVLHSLLLCHCLLLTPPSEMVGIVNMVARLTSLADGYPYFQTGPCTMRDDWAEVLRLTAGPGWIQLPEGMNWNHYCEPDVLPVGQTGAASSGVFYGTGKPTPMAQAISHWLQENMRLNGGVIKERPKPEVGEDGTVVDPPAVLRRPKKGKKKPVSHVNTTLEP